MKFAIATAKFWVSKGFDISEWRKSVDQSMALAHLEYIKILVPNAEQNSQISIYEYPSADLKAILESEMWTYENIS